MNKTNGIGESKPKQSRRQGESAPELPVERAYAIEWLAVGKVLTKREERNDTIKNCRCLCKVYAIAWQSVNVSSGLNLYARREFSDVFRFLICKS